MRASIRELPLRWEFCAHLSPQVGLAARFLCPTTTILALKRQSHTGICFAQECAMNTSRRPCVIACVRFTLLLAAVCGVCDVAAAPRFWTLAGVQFSDGAVATGTFSYDEITQKIENWHVRVARTPGGDLPVQGFTYVPGNSAAYLYPVPSAAPRPLVFALPFRVCEKPPDANCVEGTGLDTLSDFGGRALYIAPLSELDGRNATVPIDTMALNVVGLRQSREYFALRNRSRSITSGSLVLTPVPPPPAIVQVDEFYHEDLRHYFITADPAEKQALDAGIHTGWKRTGESFKAYSSDSMTPGVVRPLAFYQAGGYVNPVCRYYGDPLRGLDSHFYSADEAECARVQIDYGSDWQMGVMGVWQFESDNVFQITSPIKVSGACPAGTIPVYRLWNQREDSNHRYTTSLAIRAQMIVAGYVVEGYGPAGVVMCAVQ